MKKKLKLTDVAKHLGVSISTVSNAFNRPEPIISNCVERILAEIGRKLGYHGLTACC